MFFPFTLLLIPEKTHCLEIIYDRLLLHVIYSSFAESFQIRRERKLTVAPIPFSKLTSSIDGVVGHSFVLRLHIFHVRHKMPSAFFMVVLTNQSRVGLANSSHGPAVYHAVSVCLSVSQSFCLSVCRLIR